MNKEAMKMVKTKDLTYEYVRVLETDHGTKEEKVAALKNVNIEINKGDFVAVLGHNGSGKSTFAKHINALVQPTGGTLWVDDMDTKNDELVWEIRQTAGMVFQNPDNQLVATVVEEDIAFGPENMGVEPKEIRKRVDEALATVRMSEYATHTPSKLSGGQKQRIAIAGVLAMKPKCIVLDEPTAMLDPVGRRDVMETIERLNREEGITMILITHYMDEAALCDRIIVMDSGKIILDDTPKKVFSNVRELKTVGLDVPQTSELIYEFLKEGYNLPKDVLTEDECIKAITTLFRRKGIKPAKPEQQTEDCSQEIV